MQNCARELEKIKTFLEDENTWWKILKERSATCCEQTLPHLHGILDGSSVTLILFEEGIDEVFEFLLVQYFFVSRYTKFIFLTFYLCRYHHVVLRQPRQVKKITSLISAFAILPEEFQMKRIIAQIGRSIRKNIQTLTQHRTLLMRNRRWLKLQSNFKSLY